VGKVEQLFAPVAQPGAGLYPAGSAVGDLVGQAVTLASVLRLADAESRASSAAQKVEKTTGAYLCSQN